MPDRLVGNWLLGRRSRADQAQYTRAALRPSVLGLISSVREFNSRANESSSRAYLNDGPSRNLCAPDYSVRLAELRLEGVKHAAS